MADDSVYARKGGTENVEASLIKASMQDDEPIASGSIKTQSQINKKLTTGMSKEQAQDQVNKLTIDEMKRKPLDEIFNKIKSDLMEDNSPADTSPESTYPIQYLSRDCKDLFEEILQSIMKGPDARGKDEASQTVTESQQTAEHIIIQLKEYGNAFSTWAAFTSVFAPPDTCLEYRLRKHESTRDIIIRLLELLRQNLFIVSCELPEQEHDSEAMSEVSTALAGIEDTMKDLNKLAFRIRHSSRSSVLTVARNFARTNCSLEYLEVLAHAALEALYPNAPESLRKHLCNTMTDRYARLEYDAYKRGKIHDRTSTQAYRGQDMEDKPNEMAEARPHTLPHRMTQEPQVLYRESKQKPLSSIDTKDFNKNIAPQHRPTKQSTGSLSVYKADVRVHEPPPPRFKGGETVVDCEWCGETLDGSTLNSDGWSNPGRPWPCLSEACGESRPSFSSRKDFFDHMRSKHSASWPQSFYEQPMWICDNHAELDVDDAFPNVNRSSLYVFSSQWEFERHMRLLYHPSEPLTDCNPTGSVAQELWLRGISSLDICPLCWSAEDGNAMETEAALGQSNLGPAIDAERNTKSRVSFVDDVKQVSDDYSDLIPELEAPSSFKLQLHIAHHLQYLMVLSLRLATAADYESDAGNEKVGSESSHATRCLSTIAGDSISGVAPDGETDLPYLSNEDLNRLQNIKDQKEAMEIPLYQSDTENEEAGSESSHANKTQSITSILDRPPTRETDLPYLSEDDLGRLQNIRTEREELETSTSASPFQNLTKDIVTEDYPMDLSDAASTRSSKRDTLGDLIRRNMFEPEGQDLQSFLPLDRLEEILTWERIIRALDHEGDLTPERQNVIAQEVINPSPSRQRQPESRKKILAILSLIGKVPWIEHFIEATITDDDLPLTIKPGSSQHGGHEIPWAVGSGDTERAYWSISLFDNWEYHDVEAFTAQQWKVLVPVFALEKQPVHFAFAKEAILPFISRKVAGIGAYNAVYKVEVHAAHITSSDYSTQKSIFAIKRQHITNEYQYDMEVSNLTRFANQGHPHLIGLLWTFSLGSTYHLVLPWADGGKLMDLWRHHKFPLAKKHDCETAMWLAKQCLGIAEALTIFHGSDGHDSAGRKGYGIHGSLTPENILWFTNSEGFGAGYKLGTLKLAGFGHVIVHGIGEDAPKDFPTSMKYRAPEFDLPKKGGISQKFDIWSLGCVFLEFISWYLKGWEEMESLAIKDAFFIVDKTGETSINKSVDIEIQSLYDHPDGSQFTNEFLHLIETGLLQIEPELRYTSYYLRSEVKDIWDNCFQDPDYCLERVRKPSSGWNSDLSMIEILCLKPFGWRLGETTG
ncbi:serine threonine kinase [Fusarium sp. NRRL 52700]|nr:serine threonine kinase [Fusarium sp. NRRL 52700]